jgi:hypothetical protein
MELESLLKLIMARRETALQDSDANLAFLLATCCEELVKYDSKLYIADNYMSWVEAGNKYNEFCNKCNKIDREFTFEKLLQGEVTENLGSTGRDSKGDE